MSQYKAEIALILIALVAFGIFYLFSTGTFNTILTAVAAKYTSFIDAIRVPTRTP